MSRFAIKERQTLGIILAGQHTNPNPFSAQRRKAKEGCTKIFKIFTELPTDENLEELKAIFTEHQKDGFIDKRV